MTTGPFVELDHTADLALQVRGSDLNELFCHAAQGMFYLMHCPASHAGAGETVPVGVAALDIETLLVDWLSELLFHSELEGCCLCGFVVNVARAEEWELEGTAVAMGGAPPERVIKAVTFSDLSVNGSAEKGYVTTLTFDV